MGRKEKSILRRNIYKQETTTIVPKKRPGFRDGIGRFFSSFFFIVFLVAVLGLSIRGMMGNPSALQINQENWKESGPLELSPERGRYALLYALAENHSFQLSVDLARFTAPDVAYTNGSYVSLFAPAVSFFAVPGYLVGKYFGAAQIGSFAIIGFFAILNVLLLRAIAIRLGAHPIAASIASIAFLFASPSFSYAVTLYQHHISTFLILAGIYLLLRFNSVWSLIVIWILCGLSFAVDYPNLFLMLPVGLFGLIRTFPVEKIRGFVRVQFPLLRILGMSAIVLPLLFFLWFNKMSYGNPFQLSGTLDRAIEVKADGKPVLESEIVKQRLKLNPKLQIPEKSALGFFQNRLLMQGFYIHFISPDRGMLFYTPVMFLGFIGIFVAVRKKQPYAALLIAILGFDILLYSMWDDPYGGWAFGSRYLIPGYAMLSIFLALLLSYWRKKNLALLVFLAVFCYSVAINTMGAITTNGNPPRVEADAMAIKQHRDIPYTYEHNLELLDSNVSKSFVFQTWMQYYTSAWNYYIFVTFLIITVSGWFVVRLRASKKGDLVYEV
jgi:hypothetical protein